MNRPKRQHDYVTAVPQRGPNWFVPVWANKLELSIRETEELQNYNVVNFGGFLATT